MVRTKLVQKRETSFSFESFRRRGRGGGHTVAAVYPHCIIHVYDHFGLLSLSPFIAGGKLFGFDGLLLVLAFDT